MDQKHVESLVDKFEKPAHKSKKFLAFIFMEIWLGVLAIVALFTQKGLGWPLATFMSLIVVTMGAIALAFNGYQAALDKYFRLAALLGKAGNSLVSSVVSAGRQRKEKRKICVSNDDDSDNGGEA